MRSLVLFSLLLLAALPLPAGAAFGQPLTLIVQGGEIAAQEQPRYVTALPIAVRVAGDAARFDAVTVDALGPGGVSVRAPLQRRGAGFEGTLRLHAAGTWSIALRTLAGTETVDSAPIVIELAAPGVGALAVVLLGAFSLASIAAGAVVLSARRRGVRTRS
jgi:hypothetical protein